MEDTLEQSDVGRWNIFKLNSDKGLQSLEQSAPTTYLRFRSKENALTYQDNMFIPAVLWDTKRETSHWFIAFCLGRRISLGPKSHVFHVEPTQLATLLCLAMNNFLVSENAKAAHLRTHSGFPFALKAQSSCWRLKSYFEKMK